MYCVFWDYWNSNSPKSYKIPIKILAYPVLALSGFEQPAQELPC